MPNLPDLLVVSKRNTFLTHLALFTAAVGQPLLDITTKDFTFYVAWDLQDFAFIVTVFLIYGLIPIVVSVSGSVLGHFFRTTERVFHAIFYFLWLFLFFNLLASQEFNAAVNFSIYSQVVLCALGAGIFLFIFLRKRLIQSILSTFGAISVVVPLLIIYSGFKEGVVRFSQDMHVTGNYVYMTPNIIFFIFDELPLSTILNKNGIIDEAKFPNIYRFWQTATWFVGAETVAPGSDVAVPAILASSIGSGSAPNFRQYPYNVFTVLGQQYNILDFEFFTDLNPFSSASVTGEINEDEEGHWTARYFHRIRRKAGGMMMIAADFLVIYGHVVSHDSVRDGLPPIDTQVNRFLEARSRKSGRIARGVLHHQKFLKKLRGAEEPYLAVYHNVYPHNGWATLPSGVGYKVPRWGEYVSLNWKKMKIYDDRTKIQHDYQAHLFQSMHADKMFGDFLDTLESIGKFDNSFIIFVVDHGVSLWPGQHPRIPFEQYRNDVYGIPLLIKLPEQKQGMAVFDEVTILDFFPTVLDFIGLSYEDRVSGKSLLPLISRATPAISMDRTFYADNATVLRRAEWFGDGTSVQDLFGFGRFRDLIGREVDKLEYVQSELKVRIEEPWTFASVEANDRGPPLRVEGKVIFPGEASHARILDAAIAVNGVICAGTGTADYNSNGNPDEFTVILPPTCLSDGKNEIEVFEVDVDKGEFKQMIIAPES